MTKASYLLVLIASIAVIACGKSESRDAYLNISAITVAPFTGEGVRRYSEEKRVKAVVAEINASRSHGWQEFRGKVGACSKIIVLFRGETEVGRMSASTTPLTLIELKGSMAHSSFYAELPPGSAPSLEAILVEAPASPNCQAK